MILHALLPRPLSRSAALIAAASLLASACGGSATPLPAEQVTTTAPETVDKDFQEDYAKVLDDAAVMTVPVFMKAYEPARPATAPALSFDPSKATYFAAIDESLALTPEEKTALATNGFMVSERLRWPTMAEALLEVYHKDLPLLVTTDMMLQALHASYDEILKRMELSVLNERLRSALEKAHAALDGVDTGNSEVAGLAKRDTDFYLTVARRLLLGESVPSVFGSATDDLADTFMEHIKSEAMRSVTIFGVPRQNMDFSQFKPRGHYAGDPALEAYFQTMMWLGRVDFRFAELDQAGEWVFHHRQLVGATVLQQTMSDAMKDWNVANDLITLMVGPVDYIDFRGVVRLMEHFGFESAEDVAQMDTPKQVEVLSSLLAGSFGEQKINSHWLSTDPMTATATPLPPSFAFLGQRFVVDSYVFANVVYDNIISEDTKQPRVLPDPLDALFVLGNDQVLPHLKEELERFKYQGNLHALRHLVDGYDDAFWTSNIYNLWLDAVRTLNVPTTESPYPTAMQSDAWRDRVINTQLGSWAQLRHDTLLYAKQSYTGGVSCEHPDGYVEPYPEFFGKLATLGAVANQTLANVSFEGNEWLGTSVKQYFVRWQEVNTILQGMAAKSLAGEAYTDDEITFLKSTIMADPGCGSPVFSGWYSELYIGGEPSDWKPTIADVHTNPNTGPLPGPNVLHVATGQANLMVLTTETCEGAEAFVGPVFSYYEIDVPEIKRLTDEDWKDNITAGTLPARPEWTSSFLVPEPQP